MAYMAEEKTRRAAEEAVVEHRGAAAERRAAEEAVVEHRRAAAEHEAASAEMQLRAGAGYSSGCDRDARGSHGKATRDGAGCSRGSNRDTRGSYGKATRDGAGYGGERSDSAELDRKGRPRDTVACNRGGVGDEGCAG